MKQNFIFTLLALFSMLSLVSCSDWTETEALDSTVKKPWEQDPAMIAQGFQRRRAAVCIAVDNEQPYTVATLERLLRGEHRVKWPVDFSGWEKG